MAGSMLHARELGELAATTAATAATIGCEKLTKVLRDSPVDGTGWLLLGAQRDSEPRPCTLLALDVEMIERRSDRERLPIRAALVKCELLNDGDAQDSSTILSCLVDPSAIDMSWESGDTKAWDYKEQFTGFTHAQLLAALRARKMTPLRDLQQLIKDQMHGTAFVVGHMWQATLAASGCTARAFGDD